MVRRPMPILEVLYEPRDDPRGAGGVAHFDGPSSVTSAAETTSSHGVVDAADNSLKINK
jgi:hypothetical protein